MTSDLGARYPEGLVIRDELVWTLLYAGTEKEQWVEYRATTVAIEREAGRMGIEGRE